VKLSALFRSGILGINARNLLFIKPYNPRKAVAFADDKLKTKAFLTARGIPAAKIFARIETRRQLKQFDFKELPDECVLKPNFGFGGEGIIILKGRNRDGRFLKNGKTPIPNKDLEEHIEDILDGRYSISGHRDLGFFEQILYPHESLAKFRPTGLPDIRVIVFNLVPVMAMLRIPTSESEGKGNIHLGGIGIGIDLAKGVTTHAAQYNSIIKELPGGTSPSGIEIPFWDEILLTASKIQYFTNIGYLAADITIDKDIGPALLEVNARAGLTVQLANLAPLRERLERVEGIKIGSPEKGVRISQDLFGEKPQNPPSKTLAGEKPILGTSEIVSIAGTGETISALCRISPSKERTIFSPELIDKLIEKNAAEAEDKTGDKFRVKFTLGGIKIQSVVNKKKIPGESAEAIIGKRDLKQFLIDPSKKTDISSTAGSKVETDLRAADSTLASIDKELLFIKYLKPSNLVEERARVSADRKYNPVFQYGELRFDAEEIEKKLYSAIEDRTPLGILLEKKRRHLLLILRLLRARGKPEDFTRISAELFGRKTCDLPAKKNECLSAEEVKEKLEESLKKYALDNWTVSVRQRLVSDCTVGGNNIYIKEGAIFEPYHVQALIAHEIETHVLTSENGNNQPYAILRRGCANYLDTQEGLAIFSQNRVLPENHEKRFNAAKNVLGVNFGLSHSFAETRDYLEEELGYGSEKAVTQAIAIKRGLSDTSGSGGFTKSLVYFRGQRSVEKYATNGGDLRRLYLGKISIEDLGLIEELPDLNEPLILPEYLR